MTLAKIFKKNKNVIIGAIHFPPLFGYKNFPGFDVALKNALADLRALEAGGADGIIFENNYDVPHREFVGPETVAMMTLLGMELRHKTKLPLGVSVLWNDYKAALAIAKIVGAQFIRVPVFVDTVKTKYGIIHGAPQDVIKYRSLIGAKNIAIFVDIHVKHAEVISRMSITESARRAMRAGADAIIVTGKWTADAPDTKDLELVRKAVGNFPVLVGSGSSTENIKGLLKSCTGVIVSTSLKRGQNRKNETNVKSWKQRIDPKKVIKFVQSARNGKWEIKF